MNTFRIETPYSKQEFIKANYIRWEILSRNNRKNIRLFVISGAIILGIGILAYYDNEPNNPLLYFGIFFELLAIMMINSAIISKRKYKNEINEIAEKYDNAKMDCVYEFTEQCIKYWDKEKNLEFNWEVFTSYSIYKNYLILHLNNSIINTYIFEKKESEMDEYNKIYEFVQRKLKLNENISEKKRKVN